VVDSGRNFYMDRVVDSGRNFYMDRVVDSGRNFLRHYSESFRVA